MKFFQCSGMQAFCLSTTFLLTVIAVLICGRFFYYVAKDARISNTPPNSELEDRVSLLWTWFGFLGAYVCQLLMAVGLIIGTSKDPDQIDTETVLGNCQLWIYGAHILNLYTAIEMLIVVYYILVKNFHGSRAIITAVLAIIKIVFRIVAFVVVKLFMSDLNRPSCSCPPPESQQQHHQQQQQLQSSQQLQQQHQLAQQQQQTLQQPPQQPQAPHHPQQPPPQMMVPPPNSQFQPAPYHHPT